MLQEFLNVKRKTAQAVGVNYRLGEECWVRYLPRNLVVTVRTPKFLFQDRSDTRLIDAKGFQGKRLSTFLSIDSDMLSIIIPFNHH